MAKQAELIFLLLFDMYDVFWAQLAGIFILAFW